jgi:2-polyprenyl-3-methyl-5-hydroxy-6-metoxy-1,4-benzoquinol methylase
MKMIVAIANYGTKNVEYANKLIQEYQSMPFDVDIYILSEAPKDYGKDVTVLVGLPDKDPWSLPFAHKKLFSDNIDNYDVFIYSEDDTLIRKKNVLAFLKASDALGAEYLPGFIRYELYPDGKKNYPDIHGPYHWISNSVAENGQYVTAQLNNYHSACYVLTQTQLRKAIASGGFLVPPHSGRYDLICSAATDPYIQCGFTKVICISHLNDFDIHHLPDAYLKGTGLIAENSAGMDEEGYKLQMESLFNILAKNKSDKALFITEKPLATAAWDKDYYESCQQVLLNAIPLTAVDILSVGCGWGMTEMQLLKEGKRVTIIPLDAVIGCQLEKQGVSVCPPDFEMSFEGLSGYSFDAIVLSNVLQHVPNPVEIMTKLKALLNPGGVMVGSVPNLNVIRRVCGRIRAKSNKWIGLTNEFSKTGLNLTSSTTLKEWLRISGLRSFSVRYDKSFTPKQLGKFGRYLPGQVAASHIVFVAS